MENGMESTNFTDSFSGSDRDPVLDTRSNGRETPGQAEDQVQQSALEEREKQAGEIRQLETDINDLHDITKNLNEVIVDQGVALDRIELHTEKAGNRVEKGTVQSSNAVELKRQNRNLLWILLAISGTVVLIVVIIIIVLAVVLSTNN